MVQSAIASVAIGALSDTLNLSVLIYTGNGICREICYPDISFIIDAHTVCGTKLSRILCPDIVADNFSFRIHLDTMDCAITEVTYKKVARFVKHDSIQSVLHFGVLGDYRSQQVLICRSIGYCDVTVVHIKAIYTADKQTGRVFDL